MVNERCGSAGAWCFASGPQRKRQSYKTPGGAFEAVVHRLSACYAARTRRQQEKRARGVACGPWPWRTGELVVRPDCVVVLEVDQASIAHAVAWDLALVCWHNDGRDTLNRAYECCRTYHTTPGPRATTGMHVHES